MQETNIGAELEVTPEISLHTIVGGPTPQTMRLQGNLEKQKVVLIDSGSTHNFLYAVIAKKVDYPSPQAGDLRLWLLLVRGWQTKGGAQELL